MIFMGGTSGGPVSASFVSIYKFIFYRFCGFLSKTAFFVKIFQ
jgi:hypothetical protein